MKITPKQIKLTKAHLTNKNPIKMPTWTCINCARVYNEINAYVDHRYKSDCTLKSHTAQDLHEAAQTAYNNIITKYVHTYYTSILEAVGKGKFTCRLAFDYTDTDRETLLTEVITRLQKKFAGVVFTRHFDSSSFTADWSAPLSKTEKYIKAFQELNSSKSAGSIKEHDTTAADDIGKFGIGLKSAQTYLKEYNDGAFAKPERIIVLITTKDTDSDTPFTYFT